MTLNQGSSECTINQKPPDQQKIDNRIMFNFESAPILFRENLGLDGDRWAKSKLLLLKS